MKTISFPEGLAIHGEFPDPEVVGAIVSASGKLPLVIADPPYGNIVNKKWDRIEESDIAFCDWMIDWTVALERMSLPGAALYVWGGVGLPRNGDKPPFRPFLRYLVEAELRTGYELSTPITWKKKRAYGIQWGYLFTREELAYFILGNHKKPRKFTIPLLETKRGYAGYSEKYPAKSEFFRRTNVWNDVDDVDEIKPEIPPCEIPPNGGIRRTNVWDDVTEIMRGKAHINQKPRRLMEIPIEVHTEPGEWVLDPFAGSGTTAHAARALGRRFVVVERDSEEFEKMVASLRGEISIPVPVPEVKAVT